MASIVFVTVPEDKADTLAREVVQQRLCACVNIIKGVKSVFWWEGKVEEQKEVLLLMKTKDSLVPRLQLAVKDAHPYTVPEIIAIRIDSLNKEYLGWLNKVVDGYGFTGTSRDNI